MVVSSSESVIMIASGQRFELVAGPAGSSG